MKVYLDCLLQGGVGGDPSKKNRDSVLTKYVEKTNNLDDRQLWCNSMHSNSPKRYYSLIKM